MLTDFKAKTLSWLFPEGSPPPNLTNKFKYFLLVLRSHMLDVNGKRLLDMGLLVVRTVDLVECIEMGLQIGLGKNDDDDILQYFMVQSSESRIDSIHILIHADGEVASRISVKTQASPPPNFCPTFVARLDT
ncbi:hypothetical protein PILCRDRAFT_814310 [Piloderma croceum F 1598]|uniref:Uncharacterized protein n=1 Tax=Piloderma croceum (strain F 1598) TaxID=765440 RepID=A0A0C3CF81_PILCF|nr:hypothetical protein PILCRDRAFT_814310 [Piloderma croceum F 1598]